MPVEYRVKPHARDVGSVGGHDASWVPCPGGDALYHGPVGEVVVMRGSDRESVAATVVTCPRCYCLVEVVRL